MILGMTQRTNWASRVDSNPWRHNDPYGSRPDVHPKHCAHLGDHHISGAHVSAQPIHQPSGAIEVVEMMDCDVDSTI